MVALALTGAFTLTANTAFAYKRGAGTRLVLRTPGAYRLGLASLCSALLQTGFMTALPSGLQSRFAITPAYSAGVAIMDLTLNAAAALAVATALKHGLSVRRTATIGVAIVAISWAVFFKADALGIVILASAAFGFFLGGVNALIWGSLPAVTPSQQASGATGGLVTQATYFGVLLGPPIIFGSLHGAPTLLALVVGPAFAALLILVFPFQSHEHKMA